MFLSEIQSQDGITFVEPPLPFIIWCWVPPACWFTKHLMGQVPGSESLAGYKLAAGTVQSGRMLLLPWLTWLGWSHLGDFHTSGWKIMLRTVIWTKTYNGQVVRLTCGLTDSDYILWSSFYHLGCRQSFASHYKYIDCILVWRKTWTHFNIKTIVPGIGILKMEIRQLYNNFSISKTTWWQYSTVYIALLNFCTVSLTHIYVSQCQFVVHLLKILCDLLLQE